MDKNEIKDRLFDILNDTEDLPIQDIETEDSKDLLHIFLTDGTRFTIHVENCGSWGLYRMEE